jgi:uncharacterized repeat protein (TIGR02543 family)
MFMDSPNLTTIGDIGSLNTSNVWIMQDMFRNASGLTSLDLSGWNVSQVQLMNNMFTNTTSLVNLNVSGWNTSSLTGVIGMFYNANNLISLDVSSWDVSNVGSMHNMFMNTWSLTNIIGIENWQTDNLNSLQNTFYNARALTSLDLSRWDTSNVTNLNNTFRRDINTSSMVNLNVNGWDTSNVEIFLGTFYGLNVLETLNLYSWSTASATNMLNTFNGMTALRVLTLGPEWSVPGGQTPNLPQIPTTATYTGFWQNVGTGTIYRPNGALVYDSATLMVGNNGMSNTWIWQRWSYQVSFITGSNGTLIGGSPQSRIVPRALTLLQTEIPIPVANQGYKFVYWTSPQHPGATFTLEDILDLPITENKTFIAEFVPIEAIPVVFILNGGSVGGVPYNVYIYVMPNSPITSANVPAPIRQGYTFLGWINDSTGELLTSDQVAAIIITEAGSFTAQWRADEQTNGGGGGEAPKTGDEINLIWFLLALFSTGVLLLIRVHKNRLNIKSKNY